MFIRSCIQNPWTHIFIPKFLGVFLTNLFFFCAGVLGSVIHYPKNMAEMETEIDGCAYRTL